MYVLENGNPEKYQEQAKQLLGDGKFLGEYDQMVSHDMGVREYLTSFCWKTGHYLVFLPGFGE